MRMFNKRGQFHKQATFDIVNNGLFVASGSIIHKPGIGFVARFREYTTRDYMFTVTFVDAPSADRLVNVYCKAVGL